MCYFFYYCCHVIVQIQKKPWRQTVLGNLIRISFLKYIWIIFKLAVQNLTQRSANTLDTTSSLACVVTLTCFCTDLRIHHLLPSLCIYFYIYAYIYICVLLINVSSYKCVAASEGCSLVPVFIFILVYSCWLV